MGPTVYRVHRLWRCGEGHCGVREDMPHAACSCEQRPACTSKCLEGLLGSIWEPRQVLQRARWQSALSVQVVDGASPRHTGSRKPSGTGSALTTVPMPDATYDQPCPLLTSFWNASRACIFCSLTARKPRALSEPTRVLLLLGFCLHAMTG